MPSPFIVRPGACCERCRAVKLSLVAIVLVWATPACAAPTAALDIVARDGSGDMGPGAVAVWVSVLSVLSLHLVAVSTFGLRFAGGWWRERSWGRLMSVDIQGRKTACSITRGCGFNAGEFPMVCIESNMVWS